ncbi:flagellar biosynthesis anti-sigma factor FlgM [Dyella sp.]|jgi:negative regulator of flagellin synthesis FlgM|uniref:flagellar biosynthesis anti-sigma factor FlgM n=1 Tax=Dyella sp. TaxID=1869338 RepID=UPI002D77ABDE|nr:flagellar biosynthesis anti-sigma factor FlgM [Dyella sp.]HET6433637.1 flagellar biosynthesis anti-sigma factor FlgM [Dyella sp.]
MNTTISNNNLPKLAQANSAQGNASSQAPSSAGSADASGSAAASADRVNLTDSARALQEASRAGDSSPIDTAKVERVRQALASGSYQVNPERIADSLLSLEGQMGGTKPTPGAA